MIDQILKRYGRILVLPRDYEIWLEVCLALIELWLALVLIVAQNNFFSRLIIRLILNLRH